MLLSPITAQQDNFGDIECTSLTVVDAEGRQDVVISSTERGGRVSVNLHDGRPVIDLNTHHFGGLILVTGGRKNVAQRGGKGRAVIGVDMRGNGIVDITDYYGYRLTLPDKDED